MDLSEIFRNEILLLKGEYGSSSNHRSILFFTTMKCASSFVYLLLKRLARKTGMTSISFGDYFFNLGRTKKSLYDIYEKEAERMIKPFGYLYGPFRSFNNVKISDINNYKVVLMLRDPRDVLTSYYFSMAYSHPLPLENPEMAKDILDERKNFLKQTIDESVLQTSDYFLNIYSTYCERLLGKPNVLFLKYENMVGDFNAWLDRLIEFLQIDISRKSLDHIKSETNFTVPFEDVYSHKRQVTPGDYKRKLKTETIYSLNLKFHEILDMLGYSEAKEEAIPMTRYYKINSKEITYRFIDDETVILNLYTGEYYSLNRAGTFIWKLLENRITAEDIIDRFAEEFRIDRKNVIGDVRPLLKDFISEKMVIREK